MHFFWRSEKREKAARATSTFTFFRLLEAKKVTGLFLASSPKNRSPRCGGVANNLYAA